jgi:hypothetical protein
MKYLPTIFVSVSILFNIASCGRGRPDFTGTWVETDGQPIPGAPNSPDLEPRMIIQQDSDSISMQTAVISKSNPSRKTSLGPSVLNFDGIERHNRDGSVSKTYWQGNSLVLETTRPIAGGATSTFTNTWSLDSSNHLVIDHVLKDSNKPKPAKMRSVMKKSQPAPLK